MKSVNKIELIGNVGELSIYKELANGKFLYIFDLFTNDEYIDKNGVKQSTTERHRIKAYGGTATLIYNLCKKGDLVRVEGRLTYHEHDVNGIVAEVRCEDFIRFNILAYVYE